MKILIVDDEKAVQSLFEQQFRRERRKGVVELHFAFSGEEALAYLEKGGNADLALILSDINMPGMSGLELLKIIRENYADLQVFMITAYGDKQTRQQAEIYGADDYLTKPLDFNQLKEIIIK